MKFKRNPTVTIACVITEFLLCLVPAILLIYIFFIPDHINELLSALMIVPYFALILNIILLIISLVFSFFIKTIYRIDKEALIIQRKEDIKEIKYYEIMGISYDFGDIFSRFNRAPSQLVLFAGNGKQLLAVKNPPIIMVHLIRKKCKNAEVHFEHNKRLLFFLILINSIILLLGGMIKTLS